jgi:hypothetical protein
LSGVLGQRDHRDKTFSRGHIPIENHRIYHELIFELSRISKLYLNFKFDSTKPCHQVESVAHLVIDSPLDLTTLIAISQVSSKQATTFIIDLMMYTRVGASATMVA